MTIRAVSKALEGILGRPLRGDPGEIDRMADRDPEAFEVLRAAYEMGRRIARVS